MNFICYNKKKAQRKEGFKMAVSYNKLWKLLIDRKMKKIFNFLICFLLVTFLCLTNINLVEASGNSIYEDEFNYTCFESSSLYDSAVWSAEKDRSRPSVEDGVLKASKGYSLSFNYQK